MGREYFVIDGDGYTSSDAKDGHAPEAFGDIRKARKRARDLAKSEPWHTTVVAEAKEYFTYQPPAKKLGTIKERKVAERRKRHGRQRANHPA